MNTTLEKSWQRYAQNCPSTFSEEYKAHLRDIYMAGARQFVFFLTDPDSTIGFLRDLMNETEQWVDNWNARCKEIENAKNANPEIVPDPQTPPDSV